MAAPMQLANTKGRATLAKYGRAVQQGPENYSGTGAGKSGVKQAAAAVPGAQNPNVMALPNKVNVPRPAAPAPVAAPVRPVRRAFNQSTQSYLGGPRPQVAPVQAPAPRPVRTGGMVGATQPGILGMQNPNVLPTAQDYSMYMRPKVLGANTNLVSQDAGRERADQSLMKTYASGGATQHGGSPSATAVSSDEPGVRRDGSGGTSQQPPTGEGSEGSQGSPSTFAQFNQAIQGTPLEAIVSGAQGGIPGGGPASGQPFDLARYVAEQMFDPASGFATGMADSVNKGSQAYDEKFLGEFNKTIADLRKRGMDLTDPKVQAAAEEAARASMESGINRQRDAAVGQMLDRSNRGGQVGSGQVGAAYNSAMSALQEGERGLTQDAFGRRMQAAGLGANIAGAANEADYGKIRDLNALPRDMLELLFGAGPDVLDAINPIPFA